MHDLSKIFIIGSGAIGKALAVFLKLEKRDVVLIRGRDGNPENKKELLSVNSNDQIFKAEVKTLSLKDLPKLEGIVVLTNKSFGNHDLASKLSTKTKSPLIIMQNGLGVEDPFIAHKFEEVYRCVLFSTSQVMGDGSVKFRPVAASPIGVISGSGKYLNDVVTQLQTFDFPFKAEINIEPVIWKKVVINCAFNSICPLLEADNGIFHRDERVYAIARRVVHECVGIARSNNVMLDEQEIVDHLLLVSRASDGTHISTLQDIRNGFQTEIETLNLAVAEIARKIGKQDEVRETRLLGELTKIKADLFLKR